MVKNFEKPLEEFSEEELKARINQWNPHYGSLAQIELLRRLAVANDQSSKRFGKWSLFISIVAILISIGLGVTQILGTQSVKVINETLKTEVINGQ